MGLARVLLWALPRAAWVTTLVLVDRWVRLAEGGYGKTEDNVFGWHALLMTLAFGVFTTEAVLVYSVPLAPTRTVDQKLGSAGRILNVQKVLHALFHVLSLVSMVLGLIAIAAYKRWYGQPVYFPFFTLYSSHSWVGLGTLFMWAVQAFGGLITYLVLGPVSTWKPNLSRVHRLLGKCTYVAGLATCAMGLQDMQGSDLADSTSARPAPSAPMPPMDMLYPPPMAPMDMSDSYSMDDSGYGAHSLDARLAAVAACMFLVIGVAAFLALEFTAASQQPVSGRPSQCSDEEGNQGPDATAKV